MSLGQVNENKPGGEPAASSQEAVDRAVKRYVASWAEGQTLTVDQVLAGTERDPDHRVTREQVVRAITDFASRVTADLPGASGAESAVRDPSVGSMDTRALTGAHGPLGMPSVEGYDLVRRLGRGGMGVVFEAVQHATGRRVAIKFLLDTIIESEAARKRFEREVDVVAGLQHPGIVSILDSGIRKGRYFYVMEYVEGKPLDEAFKIGECDQRAALELVAEVCDAVDYAHQHGVLHRDLKPSNIIIDGSGRAHLLDFGLAKRLEEETEAAPRGLTMSQPGQLLGTVAYMSPEQSLGKSHETSVRTDVYSLGVIAYEMLTGRMPVEVDSGSLREILTRIAEHDPRPASNFRSGIGKDMDAVLLKALEKSPERRYATAAMFADDIRRSLAYLPVSARRIGPAGRAWRWVRRNRALSAVIATAAAVLLGVSAFLIVRIVVERDRANAALVVSKQNERYANENFNLLKGMLDSADPDRAGELTVRQFLDFATAQLDKSPPELDLTEAAVREILGSVYRKLDDYEKSERNLVKALEIRERNAKGANAELAECLHSLAATLWWEGAYDRAEGLYERSLAMRRELHRGDHQQIAASLTHLAACRLRQGNAVEARDLYTQALDMRVRLLGAEHEQVAQSLNNLAKTYSEAEDYAKAEELFRKAYDMIVRLRGENHSGTASASQNLAECLLEKGDASAAREAYLRALQTRQALFVGGHHLVAASMVGVAKAELALGHAEEAERRAIEALETYRKRSRVDHPDFADGLEVLGAALVKLGRAPLAEEHFRQAIAIVEKVRPPETLRLATLRGDLGECLVLSGKSGEGTKLLEDSFASLRQLRGMKSPLTRNAGERLFTAYRAANDGERARELEVLMNGGGE